MIFSDDLKKLIQRDLKFKNNKSVSADGYSVQYKDHCSSSLIINTNLDYEIIDELLYWFKISVTECGNHTFYYNETNEKIIGICPIKFESKNNNIVKVIFNTNIITQ